MKPAPITGADPGFTLIRRYRSRILFFGDKKQAKRVFKRSLEVL